MTARRSYIRWQLHGASFFLPLALGVFSPLAGAQTQYSSRRPTSVPSGATEVCIIGSTEFKFSQQSAPVIAERPVTLVLDNSQWETEHQIFVPALGLRIVARAGEVVKQNYVFDKPGEYKFFCDLPGHREAGMEGKLSVKARDVGQMKELPGSTKK